jgi:hypothetical protein
MRLSRPLRKRSLWHGLTAEQFRLAADQLQIANETARAQLKALFAKDTAIAASGADRATVDGSPREN